MYHVLCSLADYVEYIYIYIYIYIIFVSSGAAA